MKTSYLLGLDLGQAQDYTALVIVERQGDRNDARYDVRHIERYPLGTPYPVIVEKVSRMYGHPSLDDGRVSLVVDATGCGRPVVDLLKMCSPLAVSIHGGDKVHRDGRNYRVPKRDL
jgi:hypothetical protein